MDNFSEETFGREVCKGTYGHVAYARMQDGSYPAEDFMESLTTKQQAKFMALFVTITQNPQLQLRNRQQLKQVEGHLFEFKRNDLKMRVFAFRDRDCWYLVSGLKGKKEDDLPPAAVVQAHQLVNNARTALGLK